MKTNYTICPSCKREVYYDTFMQNVGECEGCHWMGPEWVLENVEEQQMKKHKEAYNYCDVHLEVRDCGNCPVNFLCYTEEALQEYNDDVPF